MYFDGTLKSAAFINGLNCLWSWYPFEKNCSILIAGSDYENDLTVLKKKAGYIDEYNNNENLLKEYDYIILSDYGKSRFKEKKDYFNIITELKNFLKPDGKFLMAVNNRMGIKYLCGEPDDTTGIPFDNISENKNAYKFSKNELRKFLEGFNFPKIKFYYIIPDCITPQLIYTDEYQPSSDISERLKIYISNNDSRVLNEEKLYKYLSENDELIYFVNSFIAECGTGLSDTLYCSMTPERSRKNAFITLICPDTVKKIPMYNEGISSLEKIYQNHAELKKRNVPVLDIEIKNECAVMRKVNAVSLSAYIKSLNREAFIKCIEKLYNYILMSSEHVPADQNKMLAYNKNTDWGPILKTAYVEMIPVNCFFENNNFLFFDQEYTVNNCPAKFVLFRALNDIYRLTPEMDNIVPFDEIKKYFGMHDLWGCFIREEGDFWSKKMCNEYNICNDFKKFKNNDYSITQNRKVLQMCNQNEQIRIQQKNTLFDPVSDLDGKKVILFGSGKMTEYYMSKYREKYAPEYIIDNDPDKWGKSMFDVEICSPGILENINFDEYRIIIVSGGYIEISAQLEKMGITSDNYRIYNKKIDDLIPAAISDTITFGKYNVGYVTGAFDLFHIGHLNLLKNCKSRCHYLIAGVLTDDIIRNEKHKEPFIPFEERIEIVKQCRYADRVVPVDKHNTNKINAWKELRYGCLFSGGDHQNDPNWIWLRKQLNALGSELEFFPYTQSTSSTMLQKIIRKKIEE